MDVDAKEPAPAASKEAAKPEASSHMLDNPARVTPGQEQYIAFSGDQRWQPLGADPPHSGILMCVNTRPGAQPRHSALGPDCQGMRRHQAALLQHHGSVPAGCPGQRCWSLCPALASSAQCGLICVTATLPMFWLKQRGARR